MKKSFICLIAILAMGTSAIKAESLEFAYDAGAEVVSSYLWRGQYNGGLSFQPDLAIGWNSEHTSFRFGTWWSVGASDWGFRKGLEKADGYNPNTYFVPEVDVYANLNIWGLTLGFTHYYYFQGSPFFNFGNINDIEGTSQTEVSVGYDFSTLLEDVGLSLSWNTMVSGDDAIQTNLEECEADETIEPTYKRAFSTYIEASYSHTFDYDITLTGTIGFSPWKGLYTYYMDVEGNDAWKKAALNNISLRIEKEWSLGDDLCTISVFGQGMLNTCGINKENVIVKASGDDKIGVQTLNGCIGMSVWF